MPRNASFWQVGLLDLVLSEYLDKISQFHKFNFYDVVVYRNLTAKAIWQQRDNNVLSSQFTANKCFPLILNERVERGIKGSRVTEYHSQVCVYKKEL